MEFVFNGISCRDFNLKMKKESTYVFLFTKNYESIEVPGRTGNLLIDDGTYKNEVATLVCNLDLRGIVDKTLILSSMKKWLQEPQDYKRLEFSDGIKYEAKFMGNGNFVEQFNDFYEVSLQFECKEVIEIE